MVKHWFIVLAVEVVTHSFYLPYVVLFDRIGHLQNDMKMVNIKRLMYTRITFFAVLQIRK